MDYDDEDDPYDEPGADGGNPFQFNSAAQGTSSLASLFGASNSPGGGGDLSYKPPSSRPKATPMPTTAQSVGTAPVTQQPKASILLSLRAREVYLL